MFSPKTTEIRVVHFWILRTLVSKYTGPWSPKKIFFFQIFIFDEKRIILVFWSINFGKMPLFENECLLQRIHVKYMSNHEQPRPLEGLKNIQKSILEPKNTI